MAETIGQQLKQRREAKNLTIQQVVEATRIRVYQIEAIEADDFESMPSPVQARAFLRLYAEYLGLSLDELIARQRVGVGEPSSAPSSLESSLTEQGAPTPEIGPEPATATPLRVGEKIKALVALSRRISSPQKRNLHRSNPRRRATHPNQLKRKLRNRSFLLKKLPHLP